MSTRSTTWLVQESAPFAPLEGQALEQYAVEARIYRHSDGYPEGHGADLRRFFHAVESQTSDTRYGDASYLAAKLVVHLARAFASAPTIVDGQYEYVSHADSRPLDFLSLGICSQDPGDIEYVYVLDCGNPDEAGRPSVRCFAVEHGSDWSGPLSLGAEQALPTMGAALAEDTATMIARGKREIREDVASGRVPAEVASFSELHDYVDANEYGGICDEALVSALSDEQFSAIGNVVQDALDAWIKGGGLSV